MSRAARDWAWSLAISPVQKLVALALAEHANEQGECWPSLSRLAELTGLARSTVAEALNAMEGASLITRARGGMGKSTHYRLGTAGSPAAGLVREADYREPDQGSPGAGPKSPAGGLALVREPDPNRQLNRQEPSVKKKRTRAREATERTPTTATAIRKNWRPSERVYAWAEEQGMPRAWVDRQLPEFVIFWFDEGSNRKSWDATFMNRLRTLWERTNGDSQHASVHEPSSKDYRAGATPLEDIPWLNLAAQPGRA